MDVQSLGYRTDLALRRLGGSEVVDHGDYLVVRSPANPGFYWGNFLLFAEPGPATAVAAWPEVFAAELPEARHVAIGVDTKDGSVAQLAPLTGAGLELSVNRVLVADALWPPALAKGDAECRPMASDEDWAQAEALELGADPEAARRPSYRQFVARRTAEARRMTESRQGAYYGAFLDGVARAGLGLYRHGGLARYQNVVTDPGWRRQGLASTLVWAAGRDARRPGPGRLVIVADPAYVALRLYLRLGFVDTEAQVCLERLPEADG